MRGMPSRTRKRSSISKMNKNPKPEEIGQLFEEEGPCDVVAVARGSIRRLFLSLLLLHPGDGKRCSNPPLELDLPFSLFLETRTRQTGPNDTPRPIGSQWEKEKTLVPDRFVHNPFEAEEMVTHL